MKPENERGYDQSSDAYLNGWMVEWLNGWMVEWLNGWIANVSWKPNQTKPNQTKSNQTKPNQPTVDYHQNKLLMVMMKKKLTLIKIQLDIVLDSVWLITHNWFVDLLICWFVDLLIADIWCCLEAVAPELAQVLQRTNDELAALLSMVLHLIVDLLISWFVDLSFLCFEKKTNKQTNKCRNWIETCWSKEGHQKGDDWWSNDVCQRSCHHCFSHGITWGECVTHLWWWLMIWWLMIDDWWLNWFVDLRDGCSRSTMKWDKS